MARVHIFGASGSGTTTLGAALAAALGCAHLDSDDYFWIKTDPPFRSVRETGERQRLLRRAVGATESWVLSGSLCGWGDFTVGMLDLAVFLLVPPGVRMARLRAREIERHGPEIEDPGDPRHEMHRGFLKWAEDYDEGGTDMRSRATHEAWIAELPCPVLRLEEPRPVRENLESILSALRGAQGGGDARQGEMIIRRALPSDADALARLHVASWRAAYRGLLPDSLLDGLDPERRARRFRESLEAGLEETHLALEGESLLGFVTLGACRDEDVDSAATGEIWGVYLDPARWRRGIGRRLCRHAEGLLLERGLGTVKLWVLEDNASARRFYEALGYRADGRSDLKHGGAQLRAVRYESRPSDSPGAGMREEG